MKFYKAFLFIFSITFIHITMLFSQDNIKSTIRLINNIGAMEIIEIDSKIENLKLSKKNIIKIEGLEELLNLKELSLESFSVTEIDWIPKSIKKLNLIFCKIENIICIEDFNALEIIYIEDNVIKNIDDLFKTVSIKEASFAGNYINSVNCSYNESLEELNLSSNNIKQIKNLNKLKNLKTLQIYSNPIANNREAIKQLRNENPGVNIITGTYDKKE